MPPANQKTTQKKRNRKRKRRVASSSSSSDSDSDSSSSAGPSLVVRKSPAQLPTQPVPEESSESSDSSSSSEDSDASSTKSTSPVPATRTAPSVAPQTAPRERSPSPPPTTNAVPSFLSPEDSSQDEAILRARFKKFWMASVADAFKSDLETLRKVRPTNLLVLCKILMVASGASHDEVTIGDSD